MKDMKKKGGIKEIGGRIWFFVLLCFYWKGMFFNRKKLAGEMMF